MHYLLFLLHLRTGNIFVSSGKKNCISFAACLSLSPAPRIFAKIMKPLMIVLRQMGHESADYIGDIQRLGKTKMEEEQNIIDSRAILANLGFNINYGKSVFNPIKKLKHLGFVIDSRLMTVSLTEQKVNKFKKKVNSALSDSGILSVQTLSEFLSTLESYSTAVENWQYFCKILHIEKNEFMKKSK